MKQPERNDRGPDVVYVLAAIATGADQNNATREIRLHFWYEID